MGIDPLDRTHPITLPFVDPDRVKRDDASIKEFKKEEEKAKILLPQSRSEMAQDGVKETIQLGVGEKSEEEKKEGEGSTLADYLFLNEEGEYNGADHLFFFQLPAKLPSTKGKPVMVKDKSKR